MNQKGFTIVELLVVIATTAVLAATIASSISQYMMKARDSKRISDLNNIRKALDLYFADNGYFPPSSCGYDCNGYSYSTNGTWTTLENYLKPYISKLPVDPKNNAAGPWNLTLDNYSYSYGNVGKTTYAAGYDLTGRLETPNHPLSCGIKDWKFTLLNTAHWCVNFGGSYSNQIYEASSQF
jgi:general secretion pathway protein G